jgi:hypothetical protein
MFRFFVGQLIFITTFLNIQLVHALETTFFWLPEEDIRKGACYEIDKETNGNKYRFKVPKSKCKPKQTIFSWQQTAQWTGRCYEIHPEGQEFYSSSVSKKKCRPAVPEYIFNEGTCYLIDGENGVESFALKVTKNDCRPVKLNFFWTPGRRIGEGKCQSVSNDENSQYTSTAPKKDCRPKELSYRWIQDPENPLDGKCLAFDSVNKEQGFSEWSNKKNCFTQNSPAQYQWVKGTQLGKGKCYQKSPEVDSGLVSTSKVADKFCWPDNPRQKFIQTETTKGICAVYDAETDGEVFLKEVATKKCRPQNIALALIPDERSKQLKCFMIHETTGAEGYIEKTKDKECKLLAKEQSFQWKPDASGFGGRCYKITQKGPSPVFQKKCAPKKLSYVWRYIKKYRGECYESDPAGPEYYSYLTLAKKCLPKEDNRIFKIVRWKNRESHSCFELDKKTKGKKYSVEVNNKNCKKQLADEQHQKKIDWILN